MHQSHTSTPAQRKSPFRLAILHHLDRIPDVPDRLRVRKHTRTMKRLFQRRSSNSSASSSGTSPVCSHPGGTSPFGTSTPHLPTSPDQKAPPSTVSPSTSTAAASATSDASSAPGGHPHESLKVPLPPTTTGNRFRGGSPTKVQPITNADSVSADELHARVIEYVTSSSEQIQHQALHILYTALVDPKCQETGAERHSNMYVRTHKTGMDSMHMEIDLPLFVQIHCATRSQYTHQCVCPKSSTQFK